MTILVTEGFDMYASLATEVGVQARWTQVASGGASLQTGRLGGQCFRIPGTAIFERVLSANQSSITVGLAIKFAALTGNLTAIFDLMNGTTFMIMFGVNTSGGLFVQRGNTSIYNGVTLGTSANGVIIVGQWHYVEMSIAIHDSTGTVGVKVDGASVLSLTGQDTRNGTPTDVDKLRIGSTDGSTPSCDYDDIYIINSTTPLGERRVETLRASADTAQKDFTASTGTNNAAMVDETVVNGDTDYVQAGTVGNRDLYDVGDLSSSPSVIDCINVIQFDKKTDATTRTMYNSVQSNGTDSDGTAHSLNTTYARNDRIIETDPSGGGAWTASRVNGIKIGPKVAS